MKVMTIVGARPQFIKMGPVSRMLKQYSVKEIIVHTGQHYDPSMSEVFFTELNLPEPDYNLNVGSKSHGAQTGEMIIKIEEVIQIEKPDILIVYGDTNSTLAGALSASKLHIPVAHIEAGLRSYNREMPEELNRILTDQLSDWLFCPTKTAVTCLNKINIKKNVYFSGDVMLDAVLYSQDLANTKSTILQSLHLRKIDVDSYFLCTLHRAENTDNPERLKEIVKALNELPFTTILPLHPRTKNKLQQFGLEFTNPNLFTIDPVGYLDMLILESNAKKILTDSGGIQKEAFFLKVPCITLRNETEWTETVELGTNILVGADYENILQAAHQFNVSFENIPPVFGEGDAGEKIVKQLIHDLK